ncbi:MAG: hypothetical protein L0H29_05265 [Sinobacteraceae bacterium]|nr:hypothetical protein [Nevskiaceae bacterium]
MKGRIQTWLSAGLAAAAIVATPVVQAQDDGGPGFFESLMGSPTFGFSYGGYIRNEIAVSLTGDENPWGQSGNIFNGRTVQRTGALPAASLTTINDEVTRNTPSKPDYINLEYLRGNLDFEIALTSKLRFKGTVRALFDPDIYKDFDPDEVPFADPVGNLQNDPNLFEYRYDSCPALLPAQETAQGVTEAEQRACLQAEEGSGWLERAGDQWFLDLPRFYFDYQNGGLLLRLGVQQIAWGDLLFFRVLDVPNGLDLRRHSILDFVPEEFSDKRVPAFGLRASYILPYWLPFVHDWSIDAYVQRFRSTIYSNPNTAYNVIPSQFTVHDQFKQYDNEYNYGVRFRGSWGPLDLQFVVNRKYQQFGVFQWTDADVEQGLMPLSGTGTGGGVLGQVGDLLGIDLTGLAPGFEVPATGALLADIPFEVDPTGVTSGQEFATYGALVRLNHFTGLNEAIENFPAAQALGASQASSPSQQENQEDIFFQLSGGLRGHITRDYFRENNFGFGVGWTGSGWNIDIEAKYTPDRHYTPVTLSPEDDEIPERDEYEIGFVAQEFYRYSATFPAAFLIIQGLHRSESDIFNRLLDGFGGEYDCYDDTDECNEAQVPDGIGSWNALVLAFQQPFPNRIWRIDFASLLDVQGGLLLQLGLRYKPGTKWTFQIFTTWVDTIYGDETENSLSTVDFADEITTRISYQF